LFQVLQSFIEWFHGSMNLEIASLVEEISLDLRKRYFGAALARVSRSGVGLVALPWEWLLTHVVRQLRFLHSLRERIDDPTSRYKHSYSVHDQVSSEPFSTNGID
jgi:hypothetical protein